MFATKQTARNHMASGRRLGCCWPDRSNTRLEEIPPASFQCSICFLDCTRHYSLEEHLRRVHLPPAEFELASFIMQTAQPDIQNRVFVTGGFFNFLCNILNGGMLNTIDLSGTNDTSGLMNHQYVFLNLGYSLPLAINAEALKLDRSF